MGSSQGTEPSNPTEPSTPTEPHVHEWGDWTVEKEATNTTAYYTKTATIEGSDLIEKAVAANKATDYESQEITLYAVWQDETITEFTINVNIENGTSNETIKTVQINENAAFTLTPNTGYETPSVTCTNSQIGTITNNILTIENVTANTTCDVTYKANTYSVKYNANGGTGTAMSQGTQWKAPKTEPYYRDCRTGTDRTEQCTGTQPQQLSKPFLPAGAKQGSVYKRPSID